MNHMLLAAVAFGATMAAATSPAHAQREYPVALTYVAPADVQRGEPSVVLAPVVDVREHEIYTLGSIRGGFGNPLKTLITETPVAEVVHAALRDGLAARNLLSEAGPYRMEVRLVRLDCNQLYPREAHAEILVRLLEAQSGAQLFQRVYTSGEARGGAGGGIFAPVEPLRVLTNLVMQQVIDRALDDHDFRAALASATVPEVPALAADAADPADQDETPAGTTP
jgi:hypothetical protein